MSNNADTDIGKVPGDILDLEFRGGDADKKLSNILDRRPRPPNTGSGNESVRMAAETRRRQ